MKEKNSHIFRKILKLFSSRLFFTAIGIILQIFLIYKFTNSTKVISTTFYWSNLLLGIIETVIIVNSKSNNGYKISWIILVLVMPVFGGFFYFLFAGNRASKKEKKKMININMHLNEYVKQDKQIMNKLKEENYDAYRQARYILDISQDPIFQNSYCSYFSSGETFFEDLIKELKKAEKFIFLEYFIIKPGKMWDTILSILEEKARNGVDVRIIYDDFGCISSFGWNYPKKLAEKNIKCIVFNRFVPFISVRMNNRDHRKITVIDGKVGYTGGINIADEYINEIERFGHWKDTAIKLEGDAVWNLTSLFLSIWDYLNDTVEYDYRKYKSTAKIKNNSYVSAYGTIPIINETIGENIYLNLINRAHKYIYITTPYLVIDDELTTALCNASKSGIDVRIITPAIPDKKMVNLLTKSYYPVLMDAGIKIYEYTPGFIHAKTICVDDKFASIGTTNFDYRSLYLNYECGTWIYNDNVIYDIRNDFLSTVKLSEEVNKQTLRKISRGKKLFTSVLRFLAPLA